MDTKTSRQEALTRLQDLVRELNYSIRSNFSYLAGDFEDLEMQDFVRECYKIVDTTEKLENMLSKEGF